jgi:hypothetical protein
MRTPLVAIIALATATLGAQTPTAWQSSFPVSKQTWA